MSHFKKSGIDFLKQITIGTHICQFCQTLDESLEFIPDFLNAGIDDNELCVWIVPAALSKKKAIEFLQDKVPQLKTLIENETILLYDESETYFECFEFEESKIFEFWNFIFAKFANSNFNCIRAVGCCMNLKSKDFEKFIKYEKKIAQKMINSPMIALCQYNDKNYTAFEIASITQNHKICIVKDNENWKALQNTELTIREDLQTSIKYELENLKTISTNQSDFLCNLSHDFKTPLNVILSTTQLFESKNGNFPQNTSSNKYLKIIRQNCKNILELIENITDLNKFESGMLIPNFTNVDIVKLVEDLCETFRDYVKINKLSLNLKKEHSSQIISCDEHQIKRILLNLLSNAVNYSLPNGVISVTIKQVYEIQNDSDESKPKISISVKDTGIGINKDKLDTIFERYSRTNQDLTTPGTGLGLFLVKLLTQNHNGSIEVKSTPAKGSEFIVTLPAQQ